MWEFDQSKPKRKKTVKIIRITVSVLLTMVGIAILLSQAIPITQSFLKSKVIEKVDEMQASPVPGSYKREIGGEFAYWDPGRSYFENLISQASLLSSDQSRVYNPVTKEYTEIVIDDKYSAPMSITIDSLDIKNLNIVPNVESYDEDVYNKVLKNGVAHFKSTPLPGDGGNSFIYGHSAVTSYFDNHNLDPEVAFTVLENIDIGDEVNINKDGKILTYVVRTKKVVSPDDFSILGSQSWKETVTLMTCTPVGIGTHRLIVTAELKDG